MKRNRKPRYTGGNTLKFWKLYGSFVRKYRTLTTETSANAAGPDSVLTDNYYN